MTTILDRACAERGCPMADTTNPDEITIMHTNVELEVRQQYGRQALHPHNETAQLLADLAGTKTLTTDAVKLIMKLGYTVTYIYAAVQI